MPAPVTIPVPDWSLIFDSAKDFEGWLALGKTEANLEALRFIYDEQTFNDENVDFLKGLTRPVHVLVIAEDWCPDVVRHVPVLQKMAEHTPSLIIRYITRTDHPEIFARYLTVGGEAIPKFVFFNHEFIECGEWGPMPRGLRKMIARGRAADNIGKAREHVFAAYFDDPERKIVIEEIIEEITIAACELP